MSVAFKYGATTIWLQNPERNDLLAVRKKQALAERSDGKFYRFSLADGQVYERRLAWPELRASERNNLRNFFEDLVNGVLENFIFTDEQGVLWNAHFLDPNLEFTTISDSRASTGTFTSGGVTHPTTTRTGGTYAVSVRLRLW